MRAALLASLVLLAGCETGERPSTRDAGGGGGVDAMVGGADTGVPFADAGPRPDAAPVDPLCGSAAAQWIYLVDSDDAFLRYDPAANTLEMIGTLDCPASMDPFSMAVDRDAQAWVLHQDNRIYLADSADVSCTSSAFTPGQMGMELFGMGFVAPAGSEDETLYIAGGSAFDMVLGGGATLGAIDPDTLAVRTIGSLPGWPELTGTGDGELWGFFEDTSPPSVRRIDTATAATTQTFEMPELGSGGGIGDRAWAFAFWGGRFFVFYKGDADTSTNIWRLDPEDGSVVEVMPDTGYRVVGAGVSTCAPVDLI